MGLPGNVPIIPAPPPNAAAAFLPQAPQKRSGIALCLSGGGYRAALFHLGALRRLHELGVLDKIDVITSVSGGSITSGFLALAIARAATHGISDFTSQVENPLRALTSRNIRTPAILKRCLPWNWLRPDTAAKALATEYRSDLGPFALSSLPVRPDFLFCATDIEFGVAWSFRRSEIGDYQAGYMGPRQSDDVAEAVACSSCFPPVFNPMAMRLDAASLTGGRYRQSNRAALVRNIHLTDGGVYDNLGLEPVWKDCATVLVSDGGSPFEYSADQGFISLMGRYVDLLYRQIGALRRRWLVSNFIAGILEGTYWGIAGSTSSYDPAAPGYPGTIPNDVIARIRTDLDAFSSAEAAVLENHGYSLADAALNRHVPTLVTPKPFSVPHPELSWTSLPAVQAALAKSHTRKIFGRW